jgi:hypothetical protein
MYLSPQGFFSIISREFAQVLETRLDGRGPIRQLRWIKCDPAFETGIVEHRKRFFPVNIAFPHNRRLRALTRAFHGIAGADVSN